MFQNVLWTQNSQLYFIVTSTDSVKGPGDNGPRKEGEVALRIHENFEL